MRPTLIRPLLAMGWLAALMPVHAYPSAMPQPKDKRPASGSGRTNSS